MDFIPIALLFDLGADSDPSASAQARRALVEADVIIAVDLATEHEFTVFGTPPLEETIPFEAMRTVRVGVRRSNGELDQLVALVRVLKGFRDYAG